MALFLKANFISEALKWKTKHPADKFFAGLRYEPFILEQARLTFRDYNNRFPPPANKEFIENLVKDLNNPLRNKQLLEIINPKIVTPEQQAANRQFETAAQIEQQQVAQVSQQPAPQPFSFQSAQSIPRMPLSMPSAGTTLNLPSRVAEPEPPVGPAAAKVEQLKQAVAQQPATAPLRTATVNPGLRFKPGFANTLKNFGSAAGRFFQRNVGKFLTAGRIGTAVSAGIGAITGGALTHGSAIGIFGGGGLGAVAPSWIKSGGGTRFLKRAGNGAINVGVSISNQVSSGASRLSMSSGSKKWALGLLGLLLLVVLLGGLVGGSSTPTPPGPTPSGPPPSANCSAQGTSCPLISCPLSINGSGSFNITCGTFNNPNSGGCGHGLPPAYPTCVSPPYAVCPYSDQIKAAIDVRPAGLNGSNTPVFLPFINGNSVNWTLASGPITLNGGSWGVKLEYTATTTDGKQFRLDLTHLDPNINQGANKSGDQVGITKEGVDTDGGHLHTAASLNGTWLDSITEAHMCTP